MARLIDRRSFGWLLAAASAGVAGIATAAGPPNLDGTWGGAKDGVTAQVILTGGSVIGFFWRDDYTDVDNVKFSSDGKGVSFTFKGGEATLTRTGERTATIEVREGRHVTHLDLTHD